MRVGQLHKSRTSQTAAWRSSSQPTTVESPVATMRIVRLLYQSANMYDRVCMVVRQPVFGASEVCHLMYKEV
jgi:hypothetical protein